MSKFATSVHAGSTGKLRPTNAPLDNLSVREDWSNYGYTKEYRIGVSVTHSAHLTDEMIRLSQGVALTDAVQTVKRAVVEEVFGEFRPYFRALEVALYEHDWNRARTLIREFETQMFAIDDPK